MNRMLGHSILLTGAPVSIGSRASIMAWLQGVYYVITGVWPLISIGSFQKVTGPKTDVWLVRTVGMLVIVIGATLIQAALVSRPLDGRSLAIMSALGFCTIDVVYATRGVISRIYLLDAIAEIVLVIGWVVLPR